MFKHEKRRPSWLARYIVIPTIITIFLVCLNQYLYSTVSTLQRVVMMFLVAWLLYIAAAVTRSGKLNMRVIVSCAIMALVMSLSLVSLIASLVNGKSPVLIDGRYIDVQILLSYVIVLVILDILAITFTKLTIKG